MKIIRLIFFGSLLTIWPYYTIAQTNTNMGYEAGYMGSNNTNIGYQANDIVSGNDNSAFGSDAGRSLTSGSANTFSGYQAKYIYGSGYQNVFIGESAGRENTSGYYNTLIGQKSGYENTTGRGNTFLGRQAGYFNETGEYNLFLGYYSGKQVTGDRNVLIGSYSGYYDIGDHRLYIESTTDTVSPLIYGEFDNDLLSISGRLGVNTQNIPDSIQLAVNGTIVAKEGIITTEYFPDYVFQADYKLRNLYSLERYISQNKHLPEIPSAKQAENSGLNVGDMQTILLQKIEELTLYLIEIQQENEQIAGRIAQLKAQK